MITKGKKKIGQGMFSTVYQETDQTVLIVSDDPVKECMGLGWFPNHPIFPKVETIKLQREKSIYRMEFFPKVKSLKDSLLEEEYKTYKDLKKFLSEIVFTSKDSYNVLIEAFEKSNLNPDLIEAILGALEALSNYGADVRMEISPRNVAVKNGKLILLDCFFMASAVDKKREEESKRKRLTF
jgi:hypothetical protein